MILGVAVVPHRAIRSNSFSPEARRGFHFYPYPNILRGMKFALGIEAEILFIALAEKDCSVKPGAATGRKRPHKKSSKSKINHFLNHSCPGGALKYMIRKQKPIPRTAARIIREEDEKFANR